MKSNIDFDKIYKSNNYGEYKILREIEPKVYPSGNKIRMVEVLFLQTGTIVQTKLSTATGSHAIKDNYYPRIYNVACIGDSHMIHNKLYKCWNDMINRCYNPNNRSYKYYGGIGITVSNSWLCYENFVSDAYNLPGFYEYINYDGYQLDKDTLQQGVPDNMKIYSKDTCCFIPALYNKCEEIERNNSDKFIGVKQVSDNKFIARITHNGEEIYLGTFDSPEYAANVFDYYSNLFNHPLSNNTKISIFESLNHKFHKSLIEPCKIIKKQMCHITASEDKM